MKERELYKTLSFIKKNKKIYSYSQSDHFRYKNRREVGVNAQHKHRSVFFTFEIDIFAR